MNLLQQIPEQALTVEFAVAGRYETFPDGLTHRKVAPCTIIAQAVAGRYEVASGGRTAVTEPGGAFLASGGDRLAITHHAPAAGQHMRARWLHASFRLHGTIDVVSLLVLPPTLCAAACRPFGAIIGELLAIQERVTTLRDVVRRNELALAALGLLCERASPGPAWEALLAGADRLLPVLAFIRDHLADPLAIDDLTGAARLSRSRLHVLFRSHLNLSPLGYVKRLRLAQASRRLLFTEATIKEIAWQCGFTNPYHFSRAFKLATGQAPLHYRRQHRGLQV